MASYFYIIYHISLCIKNAIQMSYRTSVQDVICLCYSLHGYLILIVNAVDFQKNWWHAFLYCKWMIVMILGSVWWQESEKYFWRAMKYLNIIYSWKAQPSPIFKKYQMQGPCRVSNMATTQCKPVVTNHNNDDDCCHHHCSESSPSYIFPATHLTFHYH